MSNWKRIELACCEAVKSGEHRDRLGLVPRRYIGCNYWEIGFWTSIPDHLEYQTVKYCPYCGTELPIQEDFKK
jgi:hypothetical protein